MSGNGFISRLYNDSDSNTSAPRSNQTVDILTTFMEI